jgi:hypothetical protein
MKERTLYKLRLRFYLLVLCVYTFLLIWLIKQQNGLLTTLSIIILLKRLFYNTRFILFSNGCKYVFMPLTKFIQHGNDANTCLKPEPGFQRSYILVCLCWDKMRGNCLLWWICWPSLFEISFHNCTVATCTVDLLNNINIL